MTHHKLHRVDLVNFITTAKDMSRRWYNHCSTHRQVDEQTDRQAGRQTERQTCEHWNCCDQALCVLLCPSFESQGGPAPSSSWHVPQCPPQHCSLSPAGTHSPIHTGTHSPIHRYTLTYTHRYTLTYTHRYTLTYTHRYTLTYTHRYALTIYTQVCTHLYTHVYTQLHTQVCIDLYTQVRTQLYTQVPGTHSPTHTGMHSPIHTGTHSWNMQYKVFRTQIQPCCWHYNDNNVATLRALNTLCLSLPTWFFCPMRCARACACKSFCGFQSLSKMTTVSAVARLTPRPPARVDNKKQKSWAHTCKQHGSITEGQDGRWLGWHC